MNSPNSGRDRLIGAALFLVALSYFALLAPYGLELADEGHLLHQIYRVSLGQLPYVDFHTGYSPGAYYLNAWLLRGFDMNLLAVRLTLALVNALCVVCLWALTRRLGVSSAMAVLSGIGYIAFIPFWDGRFAPANIPYPAWYVTLFWLLAVMSVGRWWRDGSARWWLAAGVAAGLAFTFKQNSGLLALGTCVIAATLLQRPVARRDQGPALGALLRVDRLVRWLLPTILILALFRLFGGFGPSSQAAPLLAPLAALLGGYAFLSRSSPAREAPAGVLTRNLALLGLGFAGVTLPWLVYFWSHLGTTALLRDIFYIGGSYEQHYLIPYPSLGNWGLMVILAAFALAAAPALLGWSRIRGRTLAALIIAGAIAGAVGLALRPPLMVEGFQASVVMRARDLSFAAVQVLLWVGVVAYFVRASRRSPRAGMHLLLTISALLMHMQIYPRADFMHLVYAAPGALVLGVWMLDRWALALSRALALEVAQRGPLRLAVAAPAAILAAVFLFPAAMRIDYLARAWAEGDSTALVRLAAPRAPLVIEPSAGRPFESLSATLEFLRQRTEPGDLVFSFPCLDVLTFLADRQDPGRHGYYYPGSPGHAVEAEVIDTLERTPPRYIVTLHDHAFFFVGAPVYYFNLRNYVTAAFNLERRMGMLDILAPARPGEGGGPESRPTRAERDNDEVRKTTAVWQAELRHARGATAHRLAAALEAAAPATIAELAATILSLPANQQRLLAELIQKSRSAAGGAALALAAGQAELPEREFQLFVRVIAAVADLRAVPALLEARREAPPARGLWLDGNLYTIASKAWIEAYFYAPDAEVLPPEVRTAVPSGTLIGWIEDPWQNPALRSFAMRMAGHTADPTLAPFLMRVAGAGDEMPGLRLDAAHSLVELGYGSHALPILGNLLPTDDVLATTLIVTLYGEVPEQARQIVLRHLEDPRPQIRRKAFWIAAGVGDPELLPQLRQGLRDPDEEVRVAAVWGLGRVGGNGTEEVLREAAAEESGDVALFVERALERIRRRGVDRPDGAGLMPVAVPPPRRPAASAPPERPS